MLFGIKWQILAGLVLAGMLLIIGSAGTGYSYGKSSAEAKQTKNEYKLFKKLADTALAIATEFSDLGQKVAAALEESKQNTKIIYKRQIEYVEANPLPDSCIIADPIIELRNQQITRIKRAIGVELP